MKQTLFKVSVGRFESSRSWFTTTVTLRRRKTTTRTCAKNRSEIGADPTFAIREYEKFRQHTADASKLPWRRRKGRHGTLIGRVANGAEAHSLSLLTAEPTLTTNSNPQDSARGRCVDGRDCGARAYCRVRLGRSPYGGLNENCKRYAQVPPSPI